MFLSEGGGSVGEIPRIGDVPLGPTQAVGCIVDVETTGLNPAKDEIVELAMILFVYDRQTGEVVGIVDEYIGQREPNVPIPRAATAVHGITKRQVKGMRLDDARIAGLISKASLFIAHNATFDHGFCTAYMSAFGLKPWYCSMNGVGWKQLGFESKALQRLLEDHKIGGGEAHRAGADTLGLLELLSIKDRSGAPYLRQVLRSGSIRHRISTPAASKAQVAAAKERDRWREMDEREAYRPSSREPSLGCVVIAAVAVVVILIIVVTLWSLLE
jgi:DNA polymerase-3 subunit epsilon